MALGGHFEFNKELSTLSSEPFDWCMGLSIELSICWLAAGVAYCEQRPLLLLLLFRFICWLSAVESAADMLDSIAGLNQCSGPGRMIASP